MEMETSAGRLVATAPFARCLAFRSLGLALMALDVFSMILLAYVSVVEGLELPSLFVLIVGAIGFYLVSSIAFSRRARVYENGVVPSILPFVERFSLKSPVLKSEDISEIRNMFAGTRVIGIGFETRRGRRYFVSRSEVGREMFNSLLDFKRRFYSD